MIEYKTPASDFFRCRQQFHSMHRVQSENISSWLHRLQNIVKLCDFEQLSDFMFIDKFISGLSEFDYKRVSSFATWTVEKLILMANDDLPSMENITVKSSPDSCDILSVYIKSESFDVEEVHVTDFNDYHPIDELRIKTDDPDLEVGNFTSDEPKTKKKKCMGSSERQKRFVEKLKRSGQYEDYKRRSNEKAKNRRLIRLKEKQATLGNVIKKQAPSLKEKRPRKIRERNQRCPNKPKLEDTANTSTEFECYVCLATFKKINDLKVHLTVEHQQAKRPIYQCPHCSKSTSSREILARHVNKFHNESASTNTSQKLHKCPCCDDQFVRLPQLTQHLALHPDYKPFICETCASTFTTSSNLKSHLRMHYKEKPFKCSYCDMQFIWNSSFRDHLRMHRGEKPYPCKVCDKKFRQMSGLKRHLISIHNPESKPFVCSVCSKRYVSLCQLKVHLRNHVPGDKPYQCDQCGNGFTQNSSLKKHLKEVHAAKADAKQLKWIND